MNGRTPPQDEPTPDPEERGGQGSSWPAFWFEEPSAPHAAERDETRVAATAAEPSTGATNGAEADTRRIEEPVPSTPTTDGAPAPAPAPAVARQPQRPRIVGPFEAVLRHPFLALFPLLLLTGAAVWIGIDRDPVYTAEARVNVGRADVAPFVLQNVVSGNAALAASYSRVISTEAVIRRAARRAEVDPDFARSRLDASPIPGSTLIQVEATGDDEREAVTLANAGSRALIAYITKVNRSRETRAAFRRYRRAQLKVQRLGTRVAALQRRGESARDELSRALVDLEAAKLRASNLANIYRGTTGDPTGGSPLRLIAPAASATSDRGPTLQRIVLIGVAAGLVIGLGLALLVSNRARLRSLRM